MDNDDNDYQGHGLHLVGEESSKISPVLRPYALPKFDFDEGHLRFDSLVENEVFLGIPSQEDNHWIEDFSRGSSGIEFSSSAADSCSIPRHNNVWSEATSSESVEMLLKSVGQEEIVVGESIIEESDAGDVLPSLTKTMDQNLRQDDRADEVNNRNSGLPLAEFLGSFTSLDQNPEGSGVRSNYVSQPQEVVLSAYQYSSAVGGKTSITAKENSCVDLKCNEDNLKEDRTSPVESLNNEVQKTVFVVETGSTGHSPPNILTDAGQMNVVDKISNITHESISDLQKTCEMGDQNVLEKKIVQDDEKSSKISAEAPMTDICSVVHVAPQLEVIAKPALETTDAYILESSNVPIDRNANLLTEKGDVKERSFEHALSSRSGLAPPGTDSALASESEKLLPGELSVAPKEADDGNGKGQTVEVSDKNARALSSELNKELLEGTDRKDDDLATGGKVFEVASVIVRDASSGMRMEATKQDEHSNDNGEDNVLMPQSSVSVGSVGAEVVAESSKSGDDASETHNDNPKAADHISTPGQAVSSDNCEEVSTNQALIDCNQVIAIKEKQGGNFASDPDNTPYETAGPYHGRKDDGLSSLDNITEDIVERSDGSPSVASVGIEPVLNAGTGDINTGSHGTVVEVPSQPVSSATNGVSNPNEDGKPQSSELQTSHSHKDTDVAASFGASMPLLESRDAVVKQLSDSIATKGELDKSAAALVSHGVGQSLTLEEASNKAIHVEQAVATVHQEHSDKAGSSSAKSNCDIGKSEAGAADLLKHEESIAAENHGMPSSTGGNNSSEVENPSTGTAAILSASKLLRNATEQQDTLKGVAANVSCSDEVERVAGTSLMAGVKDTMVPESSFTFNVSPLAGLPKGGNTKDMQSFSSTETSKTSTLVESSPSTSGRGQIDPLVQEVSHGSSQKPDKTASVGAAKGASERKTRRTAAKSVKENARKGNQVKEAVPMRQIDRGDASSAFFSPSGTGKLMPVELGNVERSGTKSSGVGSVSGSSLPDLNTSTSPSILFHQPFTDLQQVQLRAQIFVYGSLIQGVAPDEACMVSAFGISDGGRSAWEPAWRASIERLHGQKQHPSSSETPVQPRSGVKASDQVNKQGLSQSKVRGSGKSTPPPVVNPMIPLSSPLWNIPTPSCDTLPTNNLGRGAVLDYQALTPIHAYQTPAMRNLTGHTASWVSQAPFPVPWVASPQSSPFDLGAHFPMLPTTETAKVTASRESSLPTSSIMKHTSPLLGSVSSAVPPGTSLVHDTKRTTVSATPPTADPKSRKRKKASAGEDIGQAALPASHSVSVSSAVRNTPFASKGSGPEDLGPSSLLPRSQAELASVSAANAQFSTSVVTASPSSSAFKINPDISVRVASPISSHDHPKIADRAVDKRALQPEDIAKVIEAKLQAEEAAAHAAVAVSHCQSVWSELDKQKNSGLMSDIEAKVASAAVTIAAATSVAKAAAAAAKIASNAAMQAKHMADEALISSEILDAVHSDSVSLPGFVNSMGNATPASILKVGDGSNGSSSIIIAAREASRRRMEAASAASKHAENVDAVVKAAELAAEAVSQAGKIVALGEPLPLSKLAEAGPEGYWKNTEMPSSQDGRSNNMIGNTSNFNSVEEVPTVIERQLRPLDKEVHTTDRVTSPYPRETSGGSMEDQFRGEESFPVSLSRGEKDLRGVKSRRTSDASKTISVVPESEIGLRPNGHEDMAGALNENDIKENCLVEVYKDNDEFGAWFSANVLNLKDRKAFVCYNELESGEGKLKEWVPLEAHGNKPPVIRLAHPITSVMFEGTRKRRRAAVRDHTWSVGDRVDAWVGNCWREGVIVEKNKKDETTLSVQFPVQGRILAVKVWHLRLTSVWKDGEWIELPSTGQDYSFQGDTPQEKRAKLGSPAVEGKGKGKMPNNTDVSEPMRPEVSLMLPLSAAEKVFNIGGTKNDNKPETLRTMRSGLQKEGSKVIFGVPKPGKKRKFMDVSKHYTSDHSTKNSTSTDSEKFAKYLMPPGSGSRAWRNNSKIDAKEKQVAESKSKGFKSGKPPIVSTRTLPRKENSLVSSSAPRDIALTENVARNSTSDDRNDSSEQNLAEFVSSSNVKEGAEQMSSAAQAPASNVPKKMVASSVKSERLKKGKYAPPGGKSSKIEEKEKPVPEVVEPRRSNRRIQPTSRLLEGLQSSLIISKFPSVSHDKSHRNQNKGVSKGSN